MRGSQNWLRSTLKKFESEQKKFEDKLNEFENIVNDLIEKNLLKY